MFGEIKNFIEKRSEKAEVVGRVAKDFAELREKGAVVDLETSLEVVEKCAKWCEALNEVGADNTDLFFDIGEFGQPYAEFLAGESRKEFESRQATSDVS
jgi:hypothetical protein